MDGGCDAGEAPSPAPSELRSLENLTEVDISHQHFFLLLFLKCSFLRTCGGEIGTSQRKILGRKELQLKSSGIRS